MVLGRPADSRPRDLNREVYGDEVADAVAARDALLRRQFADPSTIDRAVGRPDDLRALELYRAHGARHLEPGVLLRLTQGDYHAGDLEAAEAWAREALRSAEELGWRDVVQWAAGDLLNALFAGPSPLSRVAEETAAMVDRWAGSLASRPALQVRAGVRAMMGDTRGARADLDEAARLRAALGLPEELDELWAEPDVAFAAGDLHAAAEACRAALAQLPDEDALNRNSMLGLYARVLLDLGHDEEAQVAVEPLERSAVVEQRAIHRSLRARLQARAGDIDTALASVGEAAALAAPTGLAIVKADVALDRAHVLLAADRVEDAMASAEDALGRYRTKEHEVGARYAVALLGAMANRDQ